MASSIDPAPSWRSSTGGTVVRSKVSACELRHTLPVFLGPNAAIVYFNKMLTECSDYETLYRNFRWDIPALFNIATACCDRHADGTRRLALIYVDEDGEATRTSFD